MNYSHIASMKAEKHEEKQMELINNPSRKTCSLLTDLELRIVVPKLPSTWAETPILIILLPSRIERNLFPNDYFHIDHIIKQKKHKYHSIIYFLYIFEYIYVQQLPITI